MNKSKKKNSDRKKIENVGSLDVNIRGKIIVVISVLAFLLIFYFLTVFITNKNAGKTDNDITDVSISYNEIVLGRSLNMSKKDYLVLCYDFSNSDYSSEFSSRIQSYKEKEEHLNLYSVDMSNGFNKKYITDGESNKTPGSVSDMKINGPTLMKISGNKVVEYIEGYDSILGYLE